MNESDKKEKLDGALCPYLTSCAIIQPGQDKLAALVERFKQSYYFKNHKGCARRWIKDFLGVQEVPELMMPQQHDWAEQILVDAGIGQTALQEKHGTSLHENNSEQ